MSYSENDAEDCFIPPFRVLFQGDVVPNPNALQYFISDIDAKLDQNTRE